MKNKESGISGALSDLMGEVSTGPGKSFVGDPQSSQGEKNQDAEPMTIHNFRMKNSDWQRLKKHMQGKGISVGSGLRMIVLEYLDKNKVR